MEDLVAADRGYADLGMDMNRIATNTELSRVLLSRGDVAGARAAADRAISIVGDVRVKSGNPEWRARFLSARYAPFEARIAVDLAGAREHDDTAAWNAFLTSEEVRARSLADELAFGTPTASAAADREAALRASLTSQTMRLESRIQRQDPDEAGTLALRREIEEIRAQIDSSQVREGGVAAQDRSLSKTLAQVRAELPADTAVLAFFIGDVHSYAWMLSRDKLRHAELEPGTALAASIARARSEQHAGTVGPATRELSRKLLGNLLADVSQKRLLVIADGVLHAVPFAALSLPGSQDQLVDRFTLGYAPSLSLVLDNRSHSRRQGKRVAVVSDPVYAPDDRRLRIAAAGNGGTLRSPPPRSPNNLTRLPFSALEASAVMRALAPDSRTIALAGFDATAKNVLSLPSGDLAILHFATHALAQTNAPEQSALFLTEYGPDGSLLPSSRLTPSEIRRSGLRADVVVLSGCATGDGRELRGEGVLGLTYGFLANGSGSVVASLWPIEDASTARFMSEFYKAYRITGRTTDALRAAQLGVRGGGGSSVWSSFVVRANDFP
jgi:CHAT domain-containing protein